jgi:antitoxin Phd
MATWQLQEAKAKFSHVVDVALKEGAQVVTRNGVPAVAIVPIEQWQKLAPAVEPKPYRTLFDVIQELRAMPGGIDEEGFELPIPPRGEWKHRPPLEFED